MERSILNFLSGYESVQLLFIFGLIIAVPALAWTRRYYQDAAKREQQRHLDNTEELALKNQIAEDESRRRTDWHNLTTKATLIDGPDKKR